MTKIKKTKSRSISLTTDKDILKILGSGVLGISGAILLYRFLNRPGDVKKEIEECLENYSKDTEEKTKRIKDLETIKWELLRQLKAVSDDIIIRQHERFDTRNVMRGGYSIEDEILQHDIKTLKICRDNSKVNIKKLNSKIKELENYNKNLNLDIIKRMGILSKLK